MTELSAKQAIDGIKAMNELMQLFKASQAKLVPIVALFKDAVRGDQMAWLQGVEQVSNLDIDDAQGALIVASGVIARIRVAIEGTECEKLLNDVFQSEES